MNLSIDGYKNNSKDSKNPYNIIPGNKITMKGVSKQLTLIPIVGGKPRHDLKVLAKPGDSDFEFGSDVEAVLELPFAQYQYGVLNPYQPAGFADESVQQGDFITYPQYGKNPQFIQGLDQYGTQKYTVGNNGFNVNSYNNDSIQINTDFLNSNPVLDPIQKAMVSASEQNIADNTLGDYNLRQKTEIKNQGRLSDLRFIGASNPYGGWNMANSAAYLGASIQRKDALGIAGSAGKILLEGFRNGMSGAAAVKRFNETEEEKKKKQYEALLNQGIQYAQKGGKLDGKLLTGNYIKGNPEHPNPNSELERGEYTQTPDGNVQEILGNRHSEGGELVDMPNGTKVVSDYLKIGAKNAKYFKNEFGLNVKSGSTFATVLDKYKSKIGLSKLLDKESTIMTKIVDQENIDNGQTRDINLQVLSENVNELKPEKEELESKFNEFTSHVFDIQESYKEETGVVDDTTEKQMGGDIQQSGEPDLEQLIVAYAQLKGVDPQEVIAQLQQFDETQIQQALQQMVSELQNAEQNQEQQPQMQKGGVMKHQVGSRIYDEGYVPTTAQLADPIYNAVMIQQGKSILGANDVEGQTYNPGSLLSTQAFMADTDTLSLFNPNYNPTKLRTSLANAKSDSERFTILNKWGQKERQNAFLEKASPELAGYVGMGYAPTQTQLQGIYDGLSKSKQAEFTDVLLKSNWGIKDGKIYGGNYKYNSDYKKGEALYDYIDNLASTDADLYNKIGRSNIADGVYDRRRENFRTMDFASVAERDVYAEKQGFKKFGNVWVDPENRNNIILPRVFRNMVVDKNKIGEYNTNKNIGPIDGYKNFGLDGVYEKWSTVPDGDQTKNPNTDDNGLTPPDLSAYRQNPQLPMMTPDQSNLPPIYLEGTMRQLDNVQSNTVRVSPMNTLKELSKQYSTAQRLASETNPYTSGAIMANMQAQQMDAINNANMQAEIANQQDERNVANINEDRIAKVEQANKAMAAQYERDTIVGQDNLYNEWRNYIDNNNRINVANWNLQNQVNMSNAMNQNYQIGVDGAITQTEQPAVFFIGGRPHMKDPKTGKITEMTVTKKDNKGKIETTQTTKSESKQKGGRLTKPFKLK